MDASSLKKPAVAFYTVADRRFFPGLVALLNSLRLVGHDQPLIVVDAGLTRGQRELLADHVWFVQAPSPAVPAVYLAQLGPAVCPADVMVLIDADIIVTRSLHELIDAAKANRVVGFIDCPGTAARHHPEWGPALGLGPVRSQPYLNAGLLVFPDSLSSRLLPPWTAGQTAIGTASTRYGKARLEDPFYFADQDVLNAVLASQFEPDDLLLLAHRLAPHPPFPGVSLVDERHLNCRYDDGNRPFLLHHVLAKPWLKATRSTVYAQLLTRLLVEPDVVVQLEPSTLPPRLRRGWAAAVDRRRAGAAVLVRTGVRHQLCRFGVRTRLRTWRARHALA